MTDTERRTAARQFTTDWTGRGDEKQETAQFWTALLSKVYGVAEPDKAQKSDMQEVFAKSIKPALLDYVCCWYKKATEFNQGTTCEVAFVSTNSVTQGQMVGDLWTLLLKEYRIVINFAWRTFVWASESSNIANVHVAIVGFSCFARKNKTIYSNKTMNIVSNISPYLLEGENILITSRKKPICDVPEISMGNQAMDGGL